MLRLFNSKRAIVAEDVLPPKRDSCCCCGRSLTNHVSRYLGIGPICGASLGYVRAELEALLDEAVENLTPEQIRKINEIRTEAEKYEQLEGRVWITNDMSQYPRYEFAQYEGKNVMFVTFKWGCEGFDEIKDIVKRTRAFTYFKEGKRKGFKCWYAVEPAPELVSQLVTALKRFDVLDIQIKVSSRDYEPQILEPKKSLKKNHCTITAENGTISVKLEKGCPSFWEMKDHLKAYGRWDRDNYAWLLPIACADYIKSGFDQYGIDYEMPDGLETPNEPQEIIPKPERPRLSELLSAFEAHRSVPM